MVIPKLCSMTRHWIGRLFSCWLQIVMNNLAMKQRLIPHIKYRIIVTELRFNARIGKLFGVLPRVVSRYRQVCVVEFRSCPQSDHTIGVNFSVAYNRNRPSGHSEETESIQSAMYLVASMEIAHLFSSSSGSVRLKCSAMLEL